MLYLILLVQLIELLVILFLFDKLRVIEITKDISIVSTPKKEKPFTPIVIKAKTGLGNHIINDLKHASE